MKIQRIHQIENYIRERETASIKELCDYFDVSKNTIRRDLKYLLESGDFEKVYGGITLKENTLIPFERRQIANQKEKKLIAKRAARFINDGDLIFVDSGTTTKYLIDYIPLNFKLTVVTNNLDVVNACATREKIELIIVGSKFKPATRSFIEYQNHTFINDLNIKKAFMAATGISIASGLTNSDILETTIKKIVTEKAQENYVLVDDSKFDHATLITFLPLKQLKVVISGGTISEEYQNYFLDHNINLELAY